MRYSFDKLALRQCRDSLGMTTKELANNIGMTVGNLTSLMYSKKPSKLSEDTIRAFDHLGITPSDLGIVDRR